MHLVIRSHESRRTDSSVRFPVVDSDGVYVLKDRRVLPNRRKSRYGLNDLKVILSKMSGH